MKGKALILIPILCLVMVAVCGGLAYSIAQQNKLTSIEYNSTLLSELQKADGKQVTITGYLSMMSPLDESYGYLMFEPFDPNPHGKSSSTVVTDTVTVYPPLGQKLPYTEKCITVTGTITYKEMQQDSSGKSYPFYLTDCTYEVCSPNADIEEYNYGMEVSAISDLDSWITEMYSGMLSPESAEKIDSALKEAAVISSLNGKECPSIEKLISVVSDFNDTYNTWVESNPEEVSDELSEAYNSVGNFMKSWLEKLQVTGVEVPNEDNGD